MRERGRERERNFIKLANLQKLLRKVLKRVTLHHVLHIKQNLLLISTFIKAKTPLSIVATFFDQLLAQKPFSNSLSNSLSSNTEQHRLVSHLISKQCYQAKGHGAGLNNLSIVPTMVRRTSHLSPGVVRRCGAHLAPTVCVNEANSEWHRC